MFIHQVLGAAEMVEFPEFGRKIVHARIDTGARTSAMHCKKIMIDASDGVVKLLFWLQFHPTDRIRCYSTTRFCEKVVKNSFGEIERRFTISALVVINNKKIRGKFTLTNREKMSYPVLIGRNFLRRRFVVDVSRLNTPITSATDFRFPGNEQINFISNENCCTVNQ